MYLLLLLLTSCYSIIGVGGTLGQCPKDNYFSGMTFLTTGLTRLFQIKVRLVMSGKAFLLELQSGSFTRLGGLVLTSQMCSKIRRPGLDFTDVF